MDQTFWQQHGDEISAAITLAVAILLALLIDRFLFGRAERATQQVDTATFSREARTRLRVVRRLIFLVIILIGVALALSQFAEIRRFATGVLASTAVLGIIIGFAARPVLANAVAGVMMAITQPIRIGDQVTIEEEQTGTVTDIALTYTTIDPGDGRLIMVPNELVTTTTVVNHSAGSREAPARASLWLPADVDMADVRHAVENIEENEVNLAELTPEGARVEVTAAMPLGAARDHAEAELREHVQDALRKRGLLG
jgi:small conductance mechanosensitive channel